MVCHSVLNTCKDSHAYQACASCGTYYVRKIPKKKKIIQSLNEWAKGIIENKPFDVQPSKCIYQRVNTLTHFHDAGSKLLDVGCGKMDFLLYAKKSGFNVSGMDIADPVIKQLIDNNIPAYRTFPEIQDETFDVVTGFDVIEHTTDPIQFLAEIRRITKKGGVLLLSTPNSLSLSARILGEHWWVFGPDGHYVLFSLIGIRKALEQNGYSILHIETNTMTQWIHTRLGVVNSIGNKILYCIVFPFLPFLFRIGLGDNIEVIARKTEIMK
jgi:2-polyprenyl-3-methyl-5-hydroxy-6-metoxy-1,4-benzoquinol methylase